MSGGPQSVYSEDALLLIFDGYPVIFPYSVFATGCNYWFNIMGKVEPSELGNMETHIQCKDHPLFAFHPHLKKNPILSPIYIKYGCLMAIISLVSREGWSVIASSSDGIIAAIEGPNIIALQFHPEVTHTKYGFLLFTKFSVSGLSCHKKLVYG